MIIRLTGLWGSAPLAFACVLAALLLLLGVAVRLSVIDARSHRLPDRIVLPAYPAALVLLGAAALAAGSPVAGVRAVGGALVLGLFYLLLRLVNPAGMGLGDVKLSGLLGLYLGFAGWTHLVLGAAAGFVLGGVWGVLLIVSGRGTTKTHIAFGPFMLAGALAVLLLLPA